MIVKYVQEKRNNVNIITMTAQNEFMKFLDKNNATEDFDIAIFNEKLSLDVMLNRYVPEDWIISINWKDNGDTKFWESLHEKWMIQLVKIEKMLGL